MSVDGTGYLIPSPESLIDLGLSPEEAGPLRGRHLTLTDDEWRTQWPGSVEDVVEHVLPAADEVVDAVEQGEVQGRPVLVVTTGTGAQLAVAARAPHHPVRLVVPADEEFEGRGAPDHVVRFSHFGERRAIAPPPDPIPPELLGG